VVNIGSQDADNYFTITGSVDGVAEMTGDGTASGKFGGSYKDTNATKSAESHIFPSKANTRADGDVTIAYNFASFDGTMLLPSWVQKLNPLSITFDNAHGGTYIADITVTYDYEVDGTISKGRQTTSVSGGYQTTISGIPLNAVNLYVQIHFEAGGDRYFNWRNPVTAWLADNIVIDLGGVWAGDPWATVRSR
jgi:hypothetical protein